MEINKIDELTKMFAENSHRKYYTRIVLVKNDARWFFYFLDVLASNRELQIPQQILFENDDIIIANINYNKDAIEYLFYNLMNKDNYYLTGSGKICEIRIFSKMQTNTLSSYNLSAQLASCRGISYPAKEFYGHLSNIIPNDINDKITGYLSLNELINDKLCLDLTKYNGLVNRFSILFEEERGKINEVRITDHFIKISLDYNVDQAKRYSIISWLDNSRNPIALERDIRFEIKKRPTNLKVRLFYDSDILDEYDLANEKQDFSFGEVRNTDIESMNDEIELLKQKLSVNPFRSNKKFDFEKIENRLNDAEIKTDARDIVQSLGEALEYACAEFCKFFRVGTKKIGLSLHDQMVQIWKGKLNIAWEDIKYQTGVRHVIRLNSLKKHDDFYPLNIESKYSILLAWRGYNEIVEMTNRLAQISSKNERQK